MPSVACHEGTCALARANRDFCTDEKRIRAENTVMDNNNHDRGFIQDHRLRADVLFIRTQSVIRADGPPSAQARAPQIEVSSDVRQCRRATIARSRAPTVISVRMKSASVQKSRLWLTPNREWAGHTTSQLCNNGGAI
jgi:hypothetical protein